MSEASQASTHVLRLHAKDGHDPAAAGEPYLRLRRPVIVTPFLGVKLGVPYAGVQVAPDGPLPPRGL